MKSAALAYVARGWPVFPCFPRSKIPATPHGLRDAVADPAGVHRLWVQKGYNLALATGPAAGIFVLDIDGFDGAAALHALEAQHGSLPATLVCLTGRGSHLYFEHPGRKVFSRSGKLAPGLDVKGDGGSSMLPPSRHASGAVYRWLDEAVPIAAAPAWLVEAVTREPERPVARFEPRTQTGGWAAVEVRRMLDCLPADMGYDDWVRVGMALHAGGYPFELWDGWSRGAPDKYSPVTTTTAWRGFREGGVSMGTLVHMAKAAGWSAERRRG